MSNCYTQFAFVVPMSDAVAVEAAEILEDLDPDSGSEDYAGTPFADLCDRLKELDEGGCIALVRFDDQALRRRLARSLGG